MKVEQQTFIIISSVRAAVENLRGRVEKLSPTESTEDAHTVPLAQCEGATGKPNQIYFFYIVFADDNTIYSARAVLRPG